MNISIGMNARTDPDVITGIETQPRSPHAHEQEDLEEHAQCYSSSLESCLRLRLLPVLALRILTVGMTRP
jgi:hypothetical protein